jgi:hypothetical protein
MSIETLMALSNTLNMSLDYIIYGTVQSELELTKNTEEVAAINDMLDHSPDRLRAYALRLMKLFVAATLPGTEDSPESQTDS